MQGVVGELEAAPLAYSGPDVKVLAGGLYALLDMLQVFLEHLDGQTQIMTQIVERPLLES